VFVMGQGTSNFSSQLAGKGLSGSKKISNEWKSEEAGARKKGGGVR